MDLAQRRFKDAVKTLTSLEAGGFQARMAGGCVRDRLMGHQPMDYDVATTAKPEQVIRHFEAAGLRTVPTGVDHGTVTLVMPSGPVEVTTLRVDVATDGRHAQVAFGTSFEEDAERRDFTINAMYEDARGTVYDYFSGQDDLKQNILRFVGDPTLRIREDYLRILRFFRFWSRFGFRPAPGSLEAIKAEKAGLARISQERITSELVKMLAGPHAKLALEALKQCGVWSMIVPEFGEGWVDATTFAAWQTAAPEMRGLAVLAGFAWTAQLASKAIQSFGERLRLSVADTRKMAFMPEAAKMLRAQGTATTTADLLDFVDACEAAGGQGSLTHFYTPVLSTAKDLQAALGKVSAAETKHGHLRIAKLPIDGNALAAKLGMKPGPELGELLAKLKRGYRNGEWKSADEGFVWVSRIRP